MIHFKKLRIAIGISGIQRFSNKSLETIRNFQRFCDVYTFAHTWEHSDFLKKYCYSNVKFNLDETAESILNKYPNVFYKVEKNERLTPHFDKLFYQVKDRNWRKNSSHISMFYSMKQADLLRRNFEQKYKIKFDCVFRMRFDSDMKTPFNPRSYNLKKLNVPMDYQYAYEKPIPGKQRGINDQFAWGPSDLMTYYCDVFDHIIPICNSGTIFCPHSILGKHLLNRNLSVDRPTITININGC